MAYCGSCEALRGQSADVDPHDHMRGEAHNLRSDGVVETYSCRPCGTKWERLVLNKAFGAQSGSWKTLSHP